MTSCGRTSHARRSSRASRSSPRAGAGSGAASDAAGQAVATATPREARRPADARTARPRAQPQRPRRRPASRERGGSDLFARILVAIPAAILAIVFIDLGGLAFALFMIAIGWLCMHELYRALSRWRPLPVVGFASLAGMVIAARYGGLKDVMEVAVATLPVLFLFALGRGGKGRLTITIAGTLLGIYWLGLAFAHAVLLRAACPTATRS